MKKNNECNYVCNASTIFFRNKFINFVDNRKSLFCHINNRECGKHTRRSLLVNAIDIFSSSDFFPERFAFRSFVFAGSINIYIA